MNTTNIDQNVRNVMIFDTETTGFLKSKPYIVSICYFIYAITSNDNETTVNLLHKAYYIVKPHNDAYEIPKESTNVHGITTKFARTNGITNECLVQRLHEIFDSYHIDEIVAHNLEFDIGVLSLQLNRFDKGDQNGHFLLDKIGDIDGFCTCHSGSDITKIEFKSKFKTSKHKYKIPKLKELFIFYFPNNKFEEHNAESDTYACARCYFKMRYDIDIDLNKHTST